MEYLGFYSCNNSIYCGYLDGNKTELKLKGIVYIQIAFGMTFFN
jgi:hypothetical protein